jgi:lysophospholipase L1-like esterase
MNSFGSVYIFSRFDSMKKFLFFLTLSCTFQLGFAQQQSFEAEVRWLSSRLDSVGWNPGGTVVTGSSTIKMWSTLKKFDTKEELINTGFGGSKASDLDRYLFPLIIKYEPKRVFIYEGDNDLWEGVEIKEILNQLKQIVLRIHLADPETEIYLIGAKPSPSRWEKRSNYLLFNSQLQAYCAEQEKVSYIDTWGPLTDSEGNARPELFIKDQLHLNADGYILWNGVFKSYFN